MGLCNFFSGRGGLCQSGENTFDEKLTDSVVSVPHAAPEVVLRASEYTKVIDIWGVGCILCEILMRKPIFQGRDYLHQIRKILEILGAPSEADIKWITNRPAAKYVQ